MLMPDYGKEIKKGLIPSHPFNIPRGRKPENPKKLFHTSLTDIQATVLKVAGHTQLNTSMNSNWSRSTSFVWSQATVKRLDDVLAIEHKPTHPSPLLEILQYNTSWSFTRARLLGCIVSFQVELIVSYYTCCKQNASADCRGTLSHIIHNIPGYNFNVQIMGDLANRRKQHWRRNLPIGRNNIDFVLEIS